MRGGPEVLPALERVAATDDGVAPRWWSIRKEALDAIETIRSRGEGSTDATEG